MPKHWPFMRLFTVWFTAITAVTVVVFILVGLRIVDGFFAYYVDAVHKETQRMLVMQVAAHHARAGGWQGYDGAEAGAIAKLSGEYFTITDTQGHTVYSSEKALEACCTDTEHKYTQAVYPIVVDGTRVGELTVGYFTKHITSPEAAAFRGSGVFLVILAILCISVTGALVAVLFFYRLSKPIRDIAATAARIAQGHWQSRVAVRSNVSEMHEIADSINALGVSLLNQEAFRQQLIVELSHELRTPLQIVLSQIEAILDGLHTADTPRLEAMYAEIARMGELLNELEDRLIYENDTFEVNIAPTDIAEITRKVVLGYEGAFSQKGLALRSDVDPALVVPADSVRFAQILINILSNALKYTSEGGVSLVLKNEGGSVTLLIADSGQGMAPAVVENISQRNDQAFKAVNSKGVGLYIAKRIIDKHGWQLHIESQAHVGTRVRVIIPNKK